MEILTWAQRKTITQTQFVSVVSKVISDGFQMNVLKNKKNVGKIKKNVKNVKTCPEYKKNVKNVFYIYGSFCKSHYSAVRRICSHFVLN